MNLEDNNFIPPEDSYDFIKKTDENDKLSCWNDKLLDIIMFLVSIIAIIILIIIIILFVNFLILFLI